MIQSFPIMFHHFYDDTHIKGDGAISADDLVKIIEILGLDNILPAKQWLNKALQHGEKSAADLLASIDTDLPIISAATSTASDIKPVQTPEATKTAPPPAEKTDKKAEPASKPSAEHYMVQLMSSRNKDDITRLDRLCCPAGMVWHINPGHGVLLHQR